jgi:archaellum component FlaG (FlaF/FlaG flagellin family)
MNTILVIASVLMAAALTGIFSTSTIAYAEKDYSADSSKTEENTIFKQRATPSGDSIANNCGNNMNGGNGFCSSSQTEGIFP